MTRPWRVTYSGAKYHITSRGNGRRQIFIEDCDYQRFLNQLKDALEKDEVILYAYVLMPNHYHLLLETPLGNVKRFMQRLNTAYSMYFRYKHGKPGHCFQGRYGAKLVAGDDYIIRLTRYIHLNPVKTRRMQSELFSERIRYLNQFRWSSYPGYIDKTKEEEIIDYRWLYQMGLKTKKGNAAAYKRYLEEMTAKDDEEFKKALKVSRYAIGGDKFIEESENDLKEMHLAKACGGGDIYRPRERIAELGDIEETVAEEFGVKPEVLHEHGHKASLAKRTAVYLSCQISARSQRCVGQYYGYTNDSSVSKLRQRFKRQMEEDKTLTKRINRLKARILKLKSITKV
ncbi:MAG: transposase [Lentisphaerae bacterium]|nr:transposase [Lentisphaerota bacterium]